MSRSSCMGLHYLKDDGVIAIMLPHDALFGDEVD